MPYLFALFFFILVNNFIASIPFIEFPTFSRAGMVYGLALLTWVIYNWPACGSTGSWATSSTSACLPASPARC